MQLDIFLMVPINTLQGWSTVRAKIDFISPKGIELRFCNGGGCETFSIRELCSIADRF